MQPSRFNVHVPIAGTRDVFLMNTLSDAQAIVSDDVLSWLDTGAGGGAAQEPERQEALATLVGQGFLVESREADDQAIARFFADHRERSDELRVTVLTTLQCNFACGYCFQGDHGHFTAHDRMSIETAEGVASWIGQQLDDIGAQRLNVTFFGGEPLLNLPVLYRLAERCSALAGARGVEFVHTVITNGLLLSEEIVDRLLPYGLVGIKVTLDGDRDTHDRLRPLRGGQGTFDRIVANITRVAERCPITIGGNFDVSTLEGYPALLAFLKAQPFAPHLARVSFKPTIRPREPRPAGRLIPLIPVDGGGQSLGTCMSTLGAAGGSPCDSCGFIDEAMSALREATKRAGFKTADGVHMGPCELHRRHAHAIGPDGSIYACPGFTSSPAFAVGHIGAPATAASSAMRARFEAIAGWKQCGDCAFVPVCGGGCSLASHVELGDMDAPTCHKAGFESALVSLAHERAGLTG